MSMHSFNTLYIYPLLSFFLSFFFFSQKPNSKKAKEDGPLPPAKFYGPSPPAASLKAAKECGRPSLKDAFKENSTTPNTQQTIPEDSKQKKGRSALHSLLL